MPGGSQALHSTELVTVVHETRELLDRKDRRRLRNTTAPLDDDHLAWILAPLERREAGQVALRILLDT